jgi:hypothetical protein
VLRGVSGAKPVDADLRALGRRAQETRSESDCVRYWSEAIRQGQQGEVRGEVVAAVQVSRREWAVPVLKRLRELGGERALRVGDWVRVVRKNVATCRCYGRVVGFHEDGYTHVEIRSGRGWWPLRFRAGALALCVNPGEDGVIYSVAAEVKAERRTEQKKKPQPRDDEETERLVELMRSRGRSVSRYGKGAGMKVIA